METTVKERIISFLREKGLSQAAFEKVYMFPIQST